MDMEIDSLRIYKRFGKKYYLAEDVENLWIEIEDEIIRCRRDEERLEELSDVEARLNAKSAENSLLAADKAKLEADRDDLTEELRRAKSDAVNEREALTRENESLRNELERAKTREKFLNADIDRKKKEIEEFERFVASDAVAEANEKAHKIMADATAESERILIEYANQRSRVAAATRSAYYNALQFKSSIMERFNMLERDLDDTIDVLRMLDAPVSDTAVTLEAGRPDTLRRESGM